MKRTTSFCSPKSAVSGQCTVASFPCADVPHRTRKCRNYELLETTHCTLSATPSPLNSKPARLTIRQELFYFASGSGNDFLRDMAQGSSKVLPLKEYIARLPQVRVNGKTHRFLNGIGYGIDGYCCQVGDELREARAEETQTAAV